MSTSTHSRLELGVVIEQLQLLVRSLLPALSRPLDATTLGILEFPQIGDNPLPGPAIGSIRLNQRPVGVSLAVPLPIAWPDEHARILNTKRLQSSRKVFTTSRSETQHTLKHHFGVNPGKLYLTRDPVWPQNIPGKTVSSPPLANLG